MSKCVYLTHTLGPDALNSAPSGCTGYDPDSLKRTSMRQRTGQRISRMAGSVTGYCTCACVCAWVRACAHACISHRVSGIANNGCDPLK